MAAKVILLEAQPRRASDGVPVTVRLAGGGDVVPYRYGNNAWKAGIARLPTIVTALEFEDEQYGTGSVATASVIEWAASSKADLAAIANYVWEDAPVTVYAGPEDRTLALPAQLLRGTVLRTSVREGRLQIALADPAMKLKKPVLRDRFAGTGGLEGPPEWEGTIRSRAVGRVFNVPGAPIDAPNNIYCFTDPKRPLQAFTAVRDKGVETASLTVLAWQGSMAATLAALRAANAPQGGGVACPSIGCVKWWTQPAGDLTADIRGEVGAGYVETAGTIAQRIVAELNGPSLSAAAIAFANGARPGPVGYFIGSDSETAAQVLDALLGSISLVWILSPLGEIEIREWAWGPSTQTVRAQSIERNRSFRPMAIRRTGYRRNQLPMSRNSLAGILFVEDLDVPAEQLLNSEQEWSDVKDGAGTKPADNATRNTGSLADKDRVGTSDLEDGAVNLGGSKVGGTLPAAKAADALKNANQKWSEVGNDNGNRPEDRATYGSTWGVNLNNRPTELVDGRVLSGLTSNGYLPTGRNSMDAIADSPTRFAAAEAGADKAAGKGLGFVDGAASAKLGGVDANATSGDSIIPNLDFRSGLDSWTVQSVGSGPPPAVVTASGSNPVKRFIRLYGDGGEVVSTEVPVGSGTVHLSFYYFQNAGAQPAGSFEARVLIAFYDNSNTLLDGSQNVYPDETKASWQFFNGSYPVPFGAATVKLVLYDSFIEAGKYLNIGGIRFAHSELGARRGADLDAGLDSGGQRIAKDALLNSSLVTNADGTTSYFDGTNWLNIGQVTLPGLGGRNLAYLDAVPLSDPSVTTGELPLSRAPRGTRNAELAVDSFTVGGVPYFRLSDAGGEVNRAVAAVGLRNDRITVDGNGLIQGIGTGAGKRIDNTKITASDAYASNLLRRANGGGDFTGELDAERTTGKSITLLTDRTADNISETTGKKWAAESGADKTAGKSLAVLVDRTADNIAETGTRKFAAESGADITANAQLTFAIPPLQTVNRDFQGAAKAGQFPRTLKPVVRRGETIITTASDIVYSITTSGVTATVSNAANNTKGDIAVTAGGAGTISLTITVAGKDYGPFAIPFETRDDPPPTSSGGGGTSGAGAKQRSDSSIEKAPDATLTQLTSAGSDETLFRISVAAGETLKCSAPLTYYREFSGQQTNGTYMRAKWQYRAFGSGTWLDVAALINGYAAVKYTDFETFQQIDNPGQISVTQSKGGLAAGEYEVRLVGFAETGGPTGNNSALITSSGTANVVAE